MATRKDQLDAFVFARRRMVANLVAPSPTGSDEGAPRPVKTFFTSAILSVIAVAGVAVLGVFKPSAPSGWEGGLAVDSSSGAAYIYSKQDTALHPILNITSARLLLGDKFKKFDVPNKTINSMKIGAPFGILGAPPDVPAAADVDLSQWNLCVQSKSNANQALSGGKTVLEIGYQNSNENPVNANTGFVVHDSAGTNYLIAGDRAYPIADTNVLAALTNSPAVGGTEGPWVSSAWLGAFTTGSTLRFPTLAGLGDPLPNGSGPGVRVGDYGTLLTSDGTTVGYIATRTGLVEINMFVYSLFTRSPRVSALSVKPMTLNPSQVIAASPKPELHSAGDSFGDVATDWPQNQVTPLDSDGAHPGFGVFCVSFSGSFDGNPPRLTLSYGTSLPQDLGPGGGVLQTAGTSLADYVLVRPGHAVLARDVSGGNSLNVGPEYLITDTGTRYLMAPGSGTPNSQGSQPSAATMLQYDKIAPSKVPDSWMKLVQVGTELDPQAAGQTPSLTQQ
jgi:type VII secretion protein EccB